jgi:Domain of unknown function (DUF6916)
MPKELSALTPDDFEPCNGQNFQLTTPRGALELRLVEVRRLGAAVRAGGAFALTFQSAPGPFLPQAIYPIAHPALGTIELFVVPLGPKDGGNQYEAVFT